MKLRYHCYHLDELVCAFKHREDAIGWVNRQSVGAYFIRIVDTLTGKDVR